jgi:hypothetical protein
MPAASTSGTGYLVGPMVVNLKGQSIASAVEAPLPTQKAHAGHLYVAEPFVLSHAMARARLGRPTNRHRRKSPSIATA